MQSNSPKKSAIIGANSMVGSRFCELAEEKYDLIKTDLNGTVPLDITNKDDVDKFFKDNNFKYVILLSAFTDVEAAEMQKNKKNELCWQINVNGTENVAQASKRFKKKLILISTDFVFDGTAGPYKEEDSVGPNLNQVSWYGFTKIEAEKKVTINKENIILRISYPYRANFAPKEDFARSILRKYKDGNLHPMFSDQTISPTFIDDVFPAIDLLILKKQTGIFHVASPLVTTPFEFAKELIHASGNSKQTIEEGSLKEFMEGKNATPKPLKGGLKVEKISNLGFTPTDFKIGIKKLFSQTRNN